MGDLTPYFSRSEIECKCGCGTYNFDHRVLGFLDRFRNWLGEPLKVTSGCRCEKHNAKVGGAAQSYHIAGASRVCKAVDVACSKYPAYELMLQLEQYSESLIITGRGIYPENNFIHIDTGHMIMARWMRTKGKYHYVNSFREEDIRYVV